MSTSNKVFLGILISLLITLVIYYFYNRKKITDNAAGISDTDSLVIPRKAGEGKGDF